MHKYAFDVKFYSSILITARNINTAKKILREIVDCADLDTRAVMPRYQGKILQTGLFLDDEGYPFLSDFDGVDVEGDETGII
jgi:hypothetical protein